MDRLTICPLFVAPVQADTGRKATKARESSCPMRTQAELEGSAEKEIERSRNNEQQPNRQEKG